MSTANLGDARSDRDKGPLGRRLVHAGKERIDEFGRFKGFQIIQLFDELIPYQYTVEDRRAGYFLGKDRRGTVHRIPLMTLSIGVVTNFIQRFSHTAQVSELAAEMKTYAKTLPGSLYVVDRRGLTGEPPADSPQNRAMDLKGTPGRPS